MVAPIISQKVAWMNNVGCPLTIVANTRLFLLEKKRISIRHIVEAAAVFILILDTVDLANSFGSDQVGSVWF